MPGAGSEDTFFGCFGVCNPAVANRIILAATGYYWKFPALVIPFARDIRHTCNIHATHMRHTCDTTLNRNLFIYFFCLWRPRTKFSSCSLKNGLEVATMLRKPFLAEKLSKNARDGYRVACVLHVCCMCVACVLHVCCMCVACTLDVSFTIELSP